MYRIFCVYCNVCISSATEPRSQRCAVSENGMFAAAVENGCIMSPLAQEWVNQMNGYLIKFFQEKWPHPSDATPFHHATQAFEYNVDILKITLCNVL